ncbi:alpha-galactosidase [Lapidilactobacillus achengensis]|uniref:Alpha-galactosidase n=1 Tax=Lapidilactobacillus achengensis TaxID=2486000 RepID=A0ABW1UQM4_9LACO|nr:alpha-galactosidase [Lapidilactobacillus achengensis]
MKESIKICVQLANNRFIPLDREDDHWSNGSGSIIVSLGEKKNVSSLSISASIPIKRIQLVLESNIPEYALYFGDDFERSYGTLHCEPMDEERIMHWYFVAKAENRYSCWGVRTTANALCAWQVTTNQIILWADIRNGIDGIDLQGRELHCCDIVTSQIVSSDEFSEVLKRFCQQLCDAPFSPYQPFIGMNDWYYAYGDNNRELIINNAKYVRKLCGSHAYQPWVVIDDGWESEYDQTLGYNGGPWQKGNQKFGDMAEVAREIKEIGVRPGIWFRPLLSKQIDREAFLRSEGEYQILDPSHPKVLQMIAADITRFTSWGYELIKHDFTTYDIFGVQGQRMTLNYFNYPVSFYDKSRTTAEIIKQLYQTIRTAAGRSVLIGCNSISHFSAGVFDIMRVGDDTSGRYFQRTRSRGVNSLAFRLHQNNVFYQCDGDCVGITARLPWSRNRKWFELLVATKTPLFISCNPKDISQDTENDMIAGIDKYLSEPNSGHVIPINLGNSRYPSVWRNATAGEIKKFSWFQNPREFYDSFPYD